ncbi:calcium-binding protein [Limnohabitans sp.]|uniref:calcium-binding protein n=1 Tax=Limnohabitans sp. TaxID=1907725 RepID=UPI002AFF89FE|nr:calcium-binding protein [Limnohabitans sp.]
MAAITPDGRQELVALYLIMFGKAPNVTQLAQMVTQKENGNTVFQVAATLSAEADFAPLSAKDPDAFATYLADALLAIDVPASARAWAINWVVTQVSGTKTKAQVIAEAVQAIRATTNTNYTSSKLELTADVTNALAIIDAPPSSSIEVQLGHAAVTKEAFLSFIAANPKHLAVNYAYANELGLSFEKMLALLDLSSSTKTALWRASFQEHGLNYKALGANNPATAGYTIKTTPLTASADSHMATTGDDSLDALAGADKVEGLAGNDLILGGEGNDTLDGGHGRDHLDGGSGNDTLYAGTNVTKVVSWYFDSYSVSEIETITYTFDDIFSDTLYGRAGDDQIYGGYGSDYLNGGDGFDLLEGDYNALNASQASPAERATMMNDTLVGGGGADTLRGGEGNDTYLYQGLPGAPEVVMGEIITDTGGTDTLWAMTSIDFTLLNMGTNTLTSMGLDQVLINSGEQATFTAAQLSGSAIRIMSSGELPAQLTVKGSAGTFDFSQLKFDVVSANNAFDSGIDRITLDFSSNINSNVTGTSLSDTILVTGESTVNAGSGDDVIICSSPFSTRNANLNGGTGTDTLNIVTLKGAGAVNLADSFLGGVTQMESLSFSGGQAAELTVGAAASVSWTSGIVITQESNASLTVNGQNSLVEITASGNDQNDVLIGGAAHDSFSGGLGSDRFVFKTADQDTAKFRATDTVTDFRKSQGDTLNVGIQTTASNFVKNGISASLSSLLTAADLSLDGTIQIFAGQVGNDSFVVTDQDGKGITQIIRLTGVQLTELESTSLVAQ